MPDTTTDARIDALLVARALHGDDHAAFAQLVRRYQGLVRAQLRRLTMGDRAWADDLAQEVFLHAWHKLDQFCVFHAMPVGNSSACRSLIPR